jgi:hypothetical protein
VAGFELKVNFGVVPTVGFGVVGVEAVAPAIGVVGLEAVGVVGLFNAPLVGLIGF